MDINNLLNEFECSCGQKHSCDIKYVYIEKNAIEKICELTKNYKNILLTADENTYAVCGERIKALLGEKCETLFVFRWDGFLVPNEDAIEKLTANITDKTDLIIGIGSGVIQDLCKYVSF